MAISEVIKETKKKIKLMFLPCPYGDCEGQIAVKTICGNSENSLKIQYYTIFENTMEAFCKNCEQLVKVRIVNNFIMVVKIQHS